jgi:thymidine kinase
MSTTVEQIQRLKLIIGPMFGGKSSEFSQNMSEYSVFNKVAIFIPASDTRSNQKIKTHNGFETKAHSYANIYDVKLTDVYKNSDIIGFDECQFSTGMDKFIREELENTSKVFILAGLDGCSDQKKFGDFLNLIPLCDTVVKKLALCQICQNGTRAPFTRCKVTKTSQTEVGGADLYFPVCRKHLKD